MDRSAKPTLWNRPPPSLPQRDIACGVCRGGVTNSVRRGRRGGLYICIYMYISIYIYIYVCVCVCVCGECRGGCSEMLHRQGLGCVLERPRGWFLSSPSRNQVLPIPASGFGIINLSRIFLSPNHTVCEGALGVRPFQVPIATPNPQRLNTKHKTQNTKHKAPTYRGTLLESKPPRALQ